jgi:lipid-binding SYLF domain-containing protein
MDSTNTSRFTTRRATLALALAAAFATAPSFAQTAQGEPQELVDASQATLSNFMRDPDMTWLQRNIGKAKGVLVAPVVVKAGYIFGGSGGRAVLYSRNANGSWQGPAFYNMGAASVGFQAGVSVSETVTLVMTDKGMKSLMEPTVKLGGDASVAAGPVGAGAASDITTDFVAFARSKGLYGGLNLEGSVIATSEDWNKAYYGKAITPSDILATGKARNPQSERATNEVGRVATTGGKS